MSRPQSSGRKPSRILHSPRKAKSNWFYTPAQVIERYNICRNTLTNWM